MPGFSGVGKVTSYARTLAGLPGIGNFWGNCPSLKVSHTPNAVERNSSMDVSRGPLRRMTQSTGAAVEIVCDEFTKKNFARSVGGRIDDVAAQEDLQHTFVTGVKVGDTLKLPHRNVQNVVIKDSTPTTALTVEEADYELDPFDGSLVIKNLQASGGSTPYVQPLKATYDTGEVVIIAGLAVTEVENWVSMSGINVDTGEPGVLDIYRARFAVADVLDFITNDYQDYTMKGAVLQDPTKVPSAIGGQYYQFVVPTSVG